MTGGILDSVTMVDDICKRSFLANIAEENARHEKFILAIEKNFKKALNTQYAHTKEHLNWDKRYPDVMAIIRKLKHELGFLECKYDKNSSQCDNIVRDLDVIRLQVPQKQEELLRKAQELDHLKDKEQEIKQRSKESKDKMKNIYNSTILAKDFFKKNLNCHLRIPRASTDVSRNSSVVHVTFGSAVSSEQSKEFLGTAQLSETNFQNWKLLAVHPTIPHFDTCAKILEESDDVRGLLCYLNQEFKDGNRKK